MSSKPKQDLSSFTASKVNAAPAPLHKEPLTVVPANDPAEQPKATRTAKEPPTPKAKEPEQLVTLNLSVAKSFRRELKQYALDLDKSMAAIIKEAVELHRQKYGRK